VQGLGAAVQGIEALIAGDIGVRSLQEHAAELAALRGQAARGGAPTVEA
jgi:carbamoyl-phosphate synthase large subunit